MSQVFHLTQTPIESGITLVEASAGTGKTYCLTGLVLRLLLERKVQGPGQILAVTFTNAATDELTTRIRSALVTAHRVLSGAEKPPDPFFEALLRQHRGEEPVRILRRALLELDDLTVATIHGFAKKVLEQQAFASSHPFHQEFLEDDESLLLDAARDVWRRLLYGADPLAAAVVVVRGWEPSTFLDDHRDWSRHPNTRIEPPALPLDTAAHRLGEARDRLRKAFDREQLLGFLGRLKTTRRGPASPGEWSRRVDGVEAFCRSGDAAGLDVVEELSWKNLQGWVHKKDHPQLEQQPCLVACEGLNRAVDAFRHALRTTFLRDVEARYRREKERIGALTFDDLLRRLHDALARSVSGEKLARIVGAQYRAALIDEFQDTDLVQYQIFSRIFSRHPLFLIGDPKQAIYRFRGADVFAYMAAKTDAQRALTLDRNWRSTQPMVQAVGALFGHAPRPFVFDEIPFSQVVATGHADRRPLRGDDGAAMRWWWVPGAGTRGVSKERASEMIQGAVTTEVIRLLEQGIELGDRPLEPGDLAILVRTNEQAQDLQTALVDAGVPAVISRAGDVFQSPEMAELRQILWAIVEPDRAGRIRAASATLLWGDDAEAILDLEEDDDAWQDRVERFARLRERWIRRGFMTMMEGLVREQNLRARVLSTPQGERRLTNLLHAAELLHQASIERHLSPTALLDWLDRERQRRDRRSESAELRLESDARAVQISTIHKSKGLEYEIVFCPFLFEARPVKKPPVLAHLDHRQMVLDYGSEQLETHRSVAEAERLAEDLRLAYVALTRARYRCYVVWGQIGQKASASASALAYLLAGASRIEQQPFTEKADAWAARALAEASNSWGSWEDALHHLVAGHSEVMSVEALDEELGLPLGDGAEASFGPWACRRFPLEAFERLRPWRMVSFSSLARRDPLADSQPLPAEEGNETAVSTLDLAAQELPDHADPALPGSAAATSTGSARGLFAFAQGTRAGTCLHLVLERCDLSDPEGEKNQRLVAETLLQHGLLEPAAHRRSGEPGPADLDPPKAVLALLRGLAHTPLPGTDFTLGQVPRDHQLIEWGFHAPLREFAPRELSRIFATFGQGRIAREYAPRLESLETETVRGFLTGFVDLVFQHEGRWYLADWKSNHLGNRRLDYGPEALWGAMQHHHYVLQYHLYLLALHLFLTQRLVDYRFDRDFGGVFYVFLRGLTQDPHNDPDPTMGWFLDRPPFDLIDALGDLVELPETLETER